MLLTRKNRLLLDDVLLISIMAVLAACGMIYEYLLSHYAARVLGSMETVIYAMIGLMIVSMGLGAFAAKQIKDEFKAFAWLEVCVALIGCSAILILASLIGFTQYLPVWVAQTFSLPPDALPQGGVIASLNWLSYKLPYVFGFLLGFLIGMEIPLIARIREHIYGKHLSNNVGTIYGADYIGAGVGAAIWVLVMLKLEINQAAALTASLNLVAGGLFLLRFWHEIASRKAVLVCHLVLALLIVLVHQYGGQWSNRMQDLLYLDKVVYQTQTRYQNLAFTQRDMSGGKGSVYNFYINGRLQFSSLDEHIYHQMLVHPAMAGSARQQRVLIVGGGDGLALREVLKWQPEQVTLIDLDEELVNLFKSPDGQLPDRLAKAISKLTQNSFSDPRVEVINDDAFIAIDGLINRQVYFDTLIVDLPDPNHPDLNKLYSKNFYARLNQLLAGDGLMVVQSTSPFHAKNAFISIGKTVKAAGFQGVEQYRQNVPTFGEWGWTIASKMGQSPLRRFETMESIPLSLNWLDLDLLRAAFVFSRGFYHHQDQVEVNQLGSFTLYQYHHSAWQAEMDIPLNVKLD